MRERKYAKLVGILRESMKCWMKRGQSNTMTSASSRRVAGERGLSPRRLEAAAGRAASSWTRGFFAGGVCSKAGGVCREKKRIMPVGRCAFDETAAALEEVEVAV